MSSATFEAELFTTAQAVNRLGESFLRLLPGVLSGVAVFGRFYLLSGLVRRAVAQDRVLTAVKGAPTENGIDLPYPTQQVLWHDQTEEADGDRARQREGWPAGSGGSHLRRAGGG